MIKQPSGALRFVVAITIGLFCMSCQTSAAADTPARPQVAKPATTAPVTEEALYAALGHPFPELRFDQIPFADAIDFLRDVSNQNLVVNWRVLESAGIDRNAPVSIRLRNVTLEQALRQMTRDVGGGAVRLGFTVDSGAIVISTLEDLNHSPRTRVYEVADLISIWPPSTEPTTQSDRSRLEQIVMESVAPDTWGDNGGTVASLRLYGDRLIVNTLDMYHRDIDRLLAELRKSQNR